MQFGKWDESASTFTNAFEIYTDGKVTAPELTTTLIDDSNTTNKVLVTKEWVQANAGASAIDDLSDVDTSTTAPTDGQVLTWDNANSEWVPATNKEGVLTIEGYTAVYQTNTKTDIGLAVSNSDGGYAFGLYFEDNGDYVINPEICVFDSTGAKSSTFIRFNRNPSGADEWLHDDLLLGSHSTTGYRVLIQAKGGADANNWSIGKTENYLEIDADGSYTTIKSGYSGKTGIKLLGDIKLETTYVPSADENIATKKYVDDNSPTDPVEHDYTATSGQTAFVISGKVLTYVGVFVNGVKIKSSNYTISDDGTDTTVTFSSGLNANDWVQLLEY
jgi:hypothetical protein